MSCRNNRLITTLAIVLSSTLLGQTPDTLWTKTYGSTRDAILFSIDQTADGGFIMSGSVGLFADSSVFWLVRTKADGDTLWTRTYGDPDSNNICQSGQLTFDGGYIMAGLGDMWLVKTDADGDTLWTRRTGGPGGHGRSPGLPGQVQVQPALRLDRPRRHHRRPGGGLRRRLRGAYTKGH